ncbi:hypothetical protein OH76DRAFT_1007988 [Lentinus brumalis]|uniref:HTH APSES-type domain-containing protein n=1 Tax=Lentinus brumalis TaxID=2498619 RepID=A0A371CY76_9APHY|nr:hypothetical protein OH76DRAFT_1007988 [Polyporus brumalis]
MPAAEHLRVAVPKPEIPRPTLPTEVNPHITSTMDGTSDPPSVQFQVLFRDGIAVTLARVKVRTPGGPVYILRRMDTGAISVTTMFRAAFPTASEEAAEAENNWIKLSFAAADQSGRPHLPGHWVTPDVALYLAEGYVSPERHRLLACECRP